MTAPKTDEAPEKKATQEDAAPSDPHEAPEPPEATHGAEDEAWETEGQDTPHLEDEVVALRARVATLEAESQGLKDKWLRALADYDNLSRRTAAERDNLTLQAAARVVGELLEPLDILQRAAADAEGIDDPHAQGIRLTHKSLRSALEREGLEDVPGVGAPFDVSVHEAIASEPADAPSGTIVDVVRPGYRLKGKLLRAALVKVSAGPEEKR